MKTAAIETTMDVTTDTVSDVVSPDTTQPGSVAAAQTDMAPNREPLLNEPPANDDDISDDVKLKDLADSFELVGSARPTHMASTTFFLAGSLASLVLVTVVMFAIEYGVPADPIAIFASGAGLCFLGLMGHLLFQNNKLIESYRDSEMLRMKPVRVMDASATLRREVDAMERRLSTFSNLVVQSSGQFQSESADIIKSFVLGTENFQKAFGAWIGEARTLSALYDDTLNQVNTAQERIHNTIGRFPSDTSKIVEEIITHFDSNVGDIVEQLKRRLESDLKYSQLSETMTEMARAVEALFTNFEEIFVQRLNEIQPQIVNSMADVSQNVQLALSSSTDQINGQLEQVSKSIKDRNDDFFKRFPGKIAEFNEESRKIMDDLSQSIHAKNTQILETIKQEKSGFERQSDIILGEFKNYIVDISTDIRNVTAQTETDFDEFLKRFNFNFEKKLNMFEEAIESNSHILGDQFMLEVENLKQNFGELTETLAQVINATVNSFDNRADKTAEEIEKHLSSIITKSIASITLRLDLFEEHVLSRLSKTENFGYDRERYTGQTQHRRPPAPNRYHNDYLNILEQQMLDMQQSLAELRRERNVA